MCLCSRVAGLRSSAGYLLRICSRPLIAPGFWLGCEAFVFGFSAFGLRTSRFDLFCPLAMIFFPVVSLSGSARDPAAHRATCL